MKVDLDPAQDVGILGLERARELRDARAHDGELFAAVARGLELPA